jgi:hypothetical protein
MNLEQEIQTALDYAHTVSAEKRADLIPGSQFPVFDRFV